MIKKIESPVKKIKYTKFIASLIGDTENIILSETFDLIFSVSALEHVPINNISKVCKDMYRI